MASVVKRRRKDGTTSWFVKYRDGNRRTRWEQFERAKDANTRKAAVELELARSGGTWTPPARTTFAAAAEDWYARKAETLRPQTLANYRSALDVWLLPAPRGRYVASLRPSDVKTLRTRLAAAGKGANTITNTVGVLRRVLDELVADRQLPHNPAALPKPGKRPGRAPRKIVVPTHAEVDLSSRLRATRRGPCSSWPPRSASAAPSCSLSPGPTSTSTPAR